MCEEFLAGLGYRTSADLWVVMGLQAVPSLIFWEVKRKDFWENMAHHFATLGLIIYSYHVK